MKKFLLALGAVCLALNGEAAPVNLQGASGARQMENSPFKFNPHKEARNVEGMMLPRQQNGLKKAPAKLGQPEDIITEADGRRQNITITGSGFYLYYGVSLQQYRSQNVASHMIYGADNEVFFYNLLPNTDFNSYVKGVKDGDKIVVDLPQTVYYNDEWGEGYNLVMLKYDTVDWEGEIMETYVYDDTVDSLTIYIGQDGAMWADIPQDCLLGLVFTSDNWWDYNGAYELYMQNFDETMVTLPEDYGCIDDFWYLNNGYYGYPIGWAPGYNENYFRGISDALPDSWILGTSPEDDPMTIRIAQNQYIGIYEGYYMWTKAAKFVYDEEGVLVDATLMPDDYQYELYWDPVANTMTPKDPEVYLLINAAKDRVWYVDYFADFKLVHQESFAGTPMDPFALRFFFAMEVFGYNALQACVPSVSTEGNLLNRDDLYYVIYLDDEVWTFEPDEYGCESPMVEIPCDLVLPRINGSNPVLKQVDFFVEGFTKIGIQSVYRYNGEETRSEIVSIDLDQAVDGVSDGKKVADVKYFDLSGRQVSDPGAGIFIKRVVYTDGTVSTFKKAVR